MAIGWLLAVVDNSIAKSVLWYVTSREIWNELDENYGQSFNAHMFALQEEANAAIQTQDMSIVEYFTKMKSIWDELDNLCPLPSRSCSNCNCILTQNFTNCGKTKDL